VKKRLSLKKLTIRDLDESVLKEMAGASASCNTCSGTCASTCYCASTPQTGCMYTHEGGCTAGACGGIVTAYFSCACTGSQTCC
jgi:hypothetical protein